MSARSFTRAETFLAGFVALAVTGCNAPSGDARAEQKETVVAAAASLRHVLPVLVDRWGKGKVIITYGASGDLRKQVEAGAPIDLVLFASRKPVTQLADAQLTLGEPSRIATNTLVLIGPDDGKRYRFADLPALPANDKLAIGDPGAVPAGDYARQMLTELGHWEALRDRIVLGGDVAAVLAYARRGEVAAAIVYRTETHGISGIAVFDEAPADAGSTPEVVGSVVTTGKNVEGATAFLAWLAGPDARQILADAGFGAP